MKNFFKLSLVISFTLFASVVNANSWGLYVEALNEGGGQSNPLGGILLLVVTGLLLLFSWAIWGKRSIRYIYGPMILGWFVIFFLIENSDRLFSIRGIVFGLPLGLIFGWLIIGCLSLCGISSPFKSFPRMSEKVEVKRTTKEDVDAEHSVVRVKTSEESRIESHDKYSEARLQYLRFLEFNQLHNGTINHSVVSDRARPLLQLFTELMEEGDGRAYFPYALLSKIVNENQIITESRTNYINAYIWYLNNVGIEDANIWLDFGYLHDPVVVEYLQFDSVRHCSATPDSNICAIDLSSVAHYWYRKAASRGSRDAIFRCAVLVENCSFIPEKFFEDISANLREQARRIFFDILEVYALKELNAAATMGHPAAQYELACRYENIGDSHDPDEIIFLLEQAAYQNYLPAIFILGDRYVNDKSCPENLQNAIIWFERCGSDIEESLMLTIATNLFENWGENTHSVEWLKLVSTKFPDGDDPRGLGEFARGYIDKMQKCSFVSTET